MLKAFSELQFNQINKRKYQFGKYKTPNKCKVLNIASKKKGNKRPR